MTELNIAFGRFMLKSLLGKGSFGEVYKAYDPQMKKEVALKVLHQGLMADLSFVNKARKEAGLVKQIQHPNVVKIFQLGEADGRAYIEMEFIDGQPLSELIKSGRRFNVEQIVSLIEQISSALEATHAKKIIHRDVKPANILIDKSGMAHLVDFGLAHAAKSSIGSSSTSVGLGTAMYMSPEQALGRTGDKTSDVYSLGVVAFELFTGRSPFQADNLPGYIQAHLHQNPPDPMKLNPGISKEIQKVLFKVLSKNSTSRYKSTGEFTQALRQASEKPEAGSDKLRGCLVGTLVLIATIALVAWAFTAGSFRDPTQKQVDLVLSVNMTATGLPETPSYVIPNSNSILTPTALFTPEASPTPEIIPFDNITTKIERYSGSTGFIIQMTGGGTPLQVTTRIDIAQAAQAISGEWTLDPLHTSSKTYELDFNGQAKDDVQPGYYILYTSSPGAGFDHLRGTWGISGLVFGNERQLVPFTVMSGKITKVTISLAKLEIGVLSPGGHAVFGELVQVYCQGQDVAGNPVGLEKSGCDNIYHKTNTTGIATFYLGAGTYIVEVMMFDPHTVHNNIVVGPGEHKTIIINVEK